MVVVIFLTATTYTQLAVAIILYPLIAYFAFKIFPRKAWKTPVVTLQVGSSAKAESTAVKANPEPVEVADIDKRAFLKLIGAAGLSYFVFSLLNRRVEAQFFGRAVATGGTVSIQDTAGKKIDPAQAHPTDGYKISEIDDGVVTYYGFTNKDGAWLVMREDTDTSSFRYAKGDFNFSAAWANRGQIIYGYFHDVF